MTGGSIPPRASAPIPGSLEPKITPERLDGHMRGRLLLPAEGFGIGPGKVQRAVAALPVSRICHEKLQPMGRRCAEVGDE